MSFPSIKRINAAIKKHRLRRELAYWGDCDVMGGHLWTLDGITPVNRKTVLRILRERGIRP